MMLNKKELMEQYNDYVINSPINHDNYNAMQHSFNRTNNIPLI